MDSRIRKTIKKNVVGVGAGRRKALCPMCIMRLEEVVMVFDHEIKQYRCNICDYVVPKHLDPINDSVIEAGNEESAMKPHIKTVQMHKTPIRNKRVTELYDSAIDAWTSDDV